MDVSASYRGDDRFMTIFKRKADALADALAESRGVFLCLIFEMSIWEFITNSKKNRFRIKLDFFSEFELDFYCLCSLQKSILKSN